MGEVDARPVHLPDSRQLHQRPVCPHWHWDRHHRFRPVWMLRHMQRKPVDAEAGERLSDGLIMGQERVDGWMIGWMDDQLQDKW